MSCPRLIRANKALLAAVFAAIFLCCIGNTAVNAALHAAESQQRDAKAYGYPDGNSTSCAKCDPEPCYQCPAERPVCCYATHDFSACCGDGQICCGTAPFGWCCIGGMQVCGNATGECNLVPNTPQPTPAPTKPADICKKCGPTECNYAACSKFSPYLCEEGTLAGSCNPNPETWANKSLCLKCCDTNECPTQPPATPVPPITPHPTPKPPPPTPRPHTPHPPTPHPPTPHPPTPVPKTPVPAPTPWDGKCDGVRCSQEFCVSLRRCPFAVPYECTSGPNIYGCSGSSHYWWHQPGCHDCCDVKTCAYLCASSCTKDQCNLRSGNCRVTSPYLCIDGHNKGECNPDKNFFPDTPGCTACCDASNCW